MTASATTVRTGGAAAAAAQRVVEWLARHRARIAGDASAVGTLALLQLRHAIDGRRCDAAATIEAAVAAAWPNPAWCSVDLATGLIAAAAARRIGGPISLAATGYLDAFGELERDGLLDGPGGMLVRLALHGRPAACPPDVPRPAAPAPGDRASLVETLDRIEEASAFGTRHLGMDRCLSAILDGAAMAALRRYDLALGCRVLRARSYLDPAPSLGLATGCDFLRLLQCDDGSFGDVDAAIAGLAAKGDADGMLRLKLPIALQALWTLAEIERPGFGIVLPVVHPSDPIR